MNKDNIERLLSNKYDERIALLDLIKFYDNKLNEHLDLKYIYTTWLSDTKNKLELLDVEIQYLQHNSKGSE